MKKLVVLNCLFFFCNFSFAQSTNCLEAIGQLQNYAAQVNQIYVYEYWTAIPNQRCPAYDGWGRPYYPQVVQNCRWQMYNSLNYWYSQQCNYVNNLYVQIIQGCAIENSNQVNNPAPDPVEGETVNNKIDVAEIEELEAGVDEDKAVKIKIPKTATGFKPRQ